MSRTLIVLAGPTAAGKSALAVRWAKSLDAEIVGADSQQVYRRFNVGTGKPSPEQLTSVPHHLISMVAPSTQFSAADYQHLADQAIADIHQRGRRVVVVGGTGLYIRALLHGLLPAPPRNPQLRGELLQAAVRDGLDSLYQRLSTFDPVAATQIHRNDSVRIIRALELWELTGKRPSEQRAAHGFGSARYAYSLHILNPPRVELYRSIDQRTRQMFDQGLVAEVEHLVQQGLRDAPPMKSVGYVQALGVVDGTITVDQAILDAAQQTRRYAKRQLTWFRKEQGGCFIEPPYPAEPPFTA